MATLIVDHKDKLKVQFIDAKAVVNIINDETKQIMYKEEDIPSEEMLNLTINPNTMITDQLSSQIISKKYHDQNSRDVSSIVIDENIHKTSSKKSKVFTQDDIAYESSFGHKTPKKFKKDYSLPKFQNTVQHITKNNSTSSISESGNYDSKKMLRKTPKIVRTKVAEELARQEFENFGSLNCDMDCSTGASSNDNDSDSCNHSNVQPRQPIVKNTNIVLRKSTRKKEVPYIYKSEEYFLSKSAKSIKKSKTSDNTLKLLKNPALDQKTIDQITTVPKLDHRENLKALHEEIVSNFSFWLCLLKEGFNILLHGLGSKRKTINYFNTSKLENESVLVVNGDFPGLSLKEILESITINLLNLESCPVNSDLAIQQIEIAQNKQNADHIYILIHNLDGTELQSHKIQYVLSRICSLKNVHLIASIDKVNAGIMFDNKTLGDYNFIWMNCTNYAKYITETKFLEPLILKSTRSVNALSALRSFFQSLTENAKRILMILIRDCIKNKTNKKYEGVKFSTLYDWCRKEFLVSSDLALRSQLVEFVDHEIIKWKHDIDILQFSVDVDILIEFFNEKEDNDEN